MRLALLLLLVALIVGCGHNGPEGVALPLEQVPQPLVDKAKGTLPGITFDHARKLPNGNYEIRGKAKNGKVREVELTPAGEVVEVE
jgi:hypothetical protein